MEMKLSLSVLIRVFAFGCFALLSAAQDFDFFYFVQQWPASYCDSQKGCCYPQTGKPASDFGIHGLWPNYNDGSYPSNCDPDQQFDPSLISDLKSEMQINWGSLACPSSDGLNFWGHEWNKHGTCSESLLNQHDYFAAAINLKKQVNVLQALTTAGIKPDGGSYDLESIKGAIKDVIGFEVYVECNRDESGNSQIYQIYVCVDTDGSTLIECPVLPRGKGCGPSIEFPTF